VYSTTESKPARSHLSVDNDAFNAVAVTRLEWMDFPWLVGSSIHQLKGSESGIVAAFDDGHVRIVE